MWKKLLAGLVSVIFLCETFLQFHDVIPTEVLGPDLEYFSPNLNFLDKKQLL